MNTFLLETYTLIFARFILYLFLHHCYLFFIFILQGQVQSTSLFLCLRTGSVRTDKRIIADWGLDCSPVITWRPDFISDQRASRSSPLADGHRSLLIAARRRSPLIAARRTSPLAARRRSPLITTRCWPPLAAHRHSPPITARRCLPARRSSLLVSARRSSPVSARCKSLFVVARRLSPLGALHRSSPLGARRSSSLVVVRRSLSIAYFWRQ